MTTSRVLTFGDVLKRFRAAAGLTQEELAEKAGLSAKGIGDLERGARLNPRRDTVQLLADALGLAERERAVLEAAARQRRLATTGVTSRSATTRGVGTAHERLSTEPPLIGREAELTLLDHYLVGDGPPLLLFAGEPGIGKSRLLREASERAIEQGWAVLAGGCHRRSGQEPYAPFLDVLEQHLARQTAAERRLHLRDCHWLVRLLPELAEMLPLPAYASGLPVEQERRLMFTAVARYLTNVAGPAGTLLVLDDLQWAGRDALDLLAFLVRAVPRNPLRVIVAYRDTEVRSSDPLAVLLADFAREGLASRTLLTPLEAHDAERLLDALIPDGDLRDSALREQLLQQTGGLPFFLVSCAQGLHSGALGASLKTSAGGAANAPIPWSVADTIRQRVAALPPSAQAVLSVAAIVGRSVQRRLLIRIAAAEQVSEREALMALEVACQARLLQEQDGDTYAFAHDLVREIIGADVSAARRALLHRQIAEVLEQGPGEPPIELLAFHYDHSVAPEKALPYLQRAAERARSRFANAEAAQHYHRLADRLDALGRPRESAAIREQLAAVLMAQSRYDEALAALELAIKAYRATGDFEGQVRTRALEGWIYARRAMPEEGLSRLEPLLTATASLPSSPGLASLHISHAYLLYAARRFEEQLPAAERAVAIAREAGDERVLIIAEERLALALQMLGRFDDALQLLETHVIPNAERLGELATMQRALINAAIMYLDRGEYEAEYHQLERAAALTERVGDEALAAWADTVRGGTSFALGDWNQARVEFERALERMRPLDAWHHSGVAAAGMAHLCVAEGKWDDASRYIADVRALGKRAALYDLTLRNLLAERDLLEGRNLDARERVAPLVTTLRATDLEHPSVQAMEHSAIAAWVLVAAGETERGQALIGPTIAWLRSVGMRPALADALHCGARIALRVGQCQAAREQLDEALTLARSLPRPYTEAKALAAYAQVHEAQGDLEHARVRLESALAILNRLGERLYAEHVERALALLAL